MGEDGFVELLEGIDVSLLKPVDPAGDDAVCVAPVVTADSPPFNFALRNCESPFWSEGALDEVVEPWVWGSGMVLAW